MGGILGYTRATAGYVVATQFEDLPLEAVSKAKLHILDALGIMLGAHGTRHALLHSLMALSPDASGLASATIVGEGRRVPDLDAVMVNAVQANFLDSSDGHFMGGHINDRLVPVALAAAERVGASGRHLLTATVLGYEVYIHLATTLFQKARAPAAGRSPHFGMLGTLASVVPVGKLLGLDEQQLAGAMGLAASTQLAGAQYVLSGGHEKDFCPGHESRRGYFAALIARQGILGSRDILEGKRGVLNMLDADGSSIEPPGGRYRITECYIKPYPACRYLHASIDAALNLVREHDIRAEDVEKAVVVTNSDSARRVSYQIDSHVNAIFSHPYQVAQVLRDGRVLWPVAWQERMVDPLFRSLLTRVEVRASREYDELHRRKSVGQPPWPAELEVTMRGGRRYGCRVMSPKGDPANPLTRDEVKQKFTRFTRRAVPPSGMDPIIQTVERLELLPDVRELLTLVTGG